MEGNAILEPHVTLSLPINLERDHLIGAEDAPVLLLEYGDYECPDCEAAFPVVNQVREKFGARLRFAFRNFPNTSIHPHAAEAAQAAESAAAQRKFWPMHDILFEHQKDLADHDITHFALLVGLELYKFEADMSSQRFAKRVGEDYESGLASGVNGTPTFFINGRRYRGKSNLETLSIAIEQASVSP